MSLNIRERKVHKILVVGDSMPITSFGVTYPELLEELGHSVEVECRSMVMSSDVVKALRDVDAYQYDLVILNFGVVDSSPRPLKQTTSRFISKIKFNLLKRVVRYIIRRYRKVIIKSRLKTIVYNNAKSFETDLVELKQLLKGQSTIFVNIGNILDTVNTDVVKARSLYQVYNNIIGDYFENVVDAYCITSRHLEESFFTDGLHYSDYGHEIICDEIIRKIGCI